MGTLVWAIGYVGWLPRTGLTRPVTRQGLGHVLTSLVSHVGYGVAASVPILLIDAARRTRAPWYARLADALDEQRSRVLG